MYNKFARVYDRLMYDVDYRLWTDIIAKEILRLNPKAKTGIDLCCGSGNFTLGLSKKGFAMTGVDKSAEMLAEAAAKDGARGITFICQDILNLNINRRFDFVVIMCDGVNYAGDVDFEKIAGLMAPGALLIFDISTYSKLKNKLGNNTFWFETDDVSYAWVNSFDSKAQKLTMDLTFFERVNDNSYERYTESHVLKAFTTEALKSRLSSFFSVRTADLNVAGEKGDRLHFFCRLKKDNSKA